MKGFTGFYYDGHPCFIREEYEEAHRGETEMQRLEDVLDLIFCDYDYAMYWVSVHHPYLLYRLDSDHSDAFLLRGRDNWAKFRDGYVHVVTGEFVKDVVPPRRDSYPCWKLEEPVKEYFDPHSATQISGKISAVITFIDLIADILGGEK